MKQYKVIYGEDKAYDFVIAYAENAEQVIAIYHKYNDTEFRQALAVKEVVKYEI